MTMNKLAASLLLAMAVKPGFALTVNTIGDEGPGNCDTTCTLRDAIATVASGGTIDFALGPDPQTIVLTNDLYITTAVNIVGPGAGLLTIGDGRDSGLFRASFLSVGAATVISGVTIAEGHVVGESFDYSPAAIPGGYARGGCISTNAPLTLMHVAMNYCSATAGNAGNGGAYWGGDALGGAIYADGALTLIDSTISFSQVHGGKGADFELEGGAGGGALGCAIYARSGPVTISNSTISGCLAVGGEGGAGPCGFGGQAGTGGNARGSLWIADNVASASITSSTFHDNVMTPGLGGFHYSCERPGGSASGAAIANVGLGTSIDASTFMNNSAINGGAIENAKTLKIINSTLANNSGVAGAGISNKPGATLIVASSTLAGNAASSSGGGIQNSGTLYLLSSIVSANSAPTGADVYGLGPGNNSLGYNLIGDATSSGLAATAGDQFGTTATPIDAKFSAAGLADNGGLTKTIAVQPTSPARNAGNCAVNANPAIAAITVDQRDHLRGTPCTIGAYDLDPIFNNGFDG